MIFNRVLRHSPSTPLLTMATPSARLLAPRGRVRGDHTKAGLGRCTTLCPSLADTHPGTSRIPSWAFSQNRGCQGGLRTSPPDQSSILCSIRLLLALFSPKQSWAAVPLRGPGHIPALHLPAPGENTTRRGKNSDDEEEGKRRSSTLSGVLPFGRRTDSPIPPTLCSQSPPGSTQL